MSGLFFYRHVGPYGPKEKTLGKKTVLAMVGAVFSCACMDCARGFLFPRARFCCLNQDGQDEQDGQDRASAGMRRKGLKDLNVYRFGRNAAKRSVRTLMCPAASAVRARDRPSRYGDWGAFFL